MKKISTFWFLLAAGIFYASAQTHTTEHFVITYDIDKVPSRKDRSYLPPGVNPAQLPEFGDPDWEDDPENPGQKRRTIPYYILDMGKNLETALKVYVNLELTTYTELTPTKSDHQANDPGGVRKVSVIVKNIVDSGNNPIDGESDATMGIIYLNENVAVSKDEPDKVKVLRKVCAHELLHYITSRTYNAWFAKLSVLSSDYGSQQWWWECLAVQADRLVFPDQHPYEAELYAMDKNAIYTNVGNSWDVCNNDPDWYVSSGFLTYLLYYREGQKAKFSDIFFAPNKNLSNLLSCVRTTLDTYVKESLQSKGLGDEYQAYLNFLLAMSQPQFCIKSGNDERPTYLTTVRLKNDNFQAQTNCEAEVPYMSMRVYRFLQGSVSNETRYTLVSPALTLEEMTAQSVKDVMSGNTTPLPCNLFAYECTEGSRKLLKQLYPGDSLHVFYEKGKWIEVAMINASLASKGVGKVMLLRYPSLAGTYKGKIIFSGTNPKLDEMYTISLSNFQMEIDAKGEAALGFEFHKSYRKDGYYAKAEKIVGKVDKTGLFSIVGPVEAFTYPKGCSNCCDFPQVKDDPKCMKMPANPYYWKFDGQIVQDKQGWMLKGDIAAGFRPDKFMKASEKLYKFEARRAD